MDESKRVKTIYGDFAVADTEIKKEIADKDCTIHVITGNCWVNPLGVAGLDDVSIMLKEDMILDLHIMGDLSLISDETGATVQIIIWR